MRLLWLAGAVMGTAVCNLATAAQERIEQKKIEQILPQSRWLIEGEEHSNTARPKPGPEKSAPELNSLKDIYAAVYRCYKPPPLNEAKPGMRVTVQFTYTRNGELFGKPRILYESPGATPAQQSAYRAAVAAALVRCTPLPFSKSLGNAVAGRVLSMQFVDERNLRGAERTIPQLPLDTMNTASFDRSDEWPIPRTH